jgi:hypothetical protein
MRRARLHAIRDEPAKARARIATAEEAVARRGTDRERSHVEALSLAIDGQSAKALERALAHADAWPRDVLILALPLGAFGLFAFSGMADHDQARVDLCERHARRFDADDWWFLTYRGWAHAENGDVALGRALTQRGFDLRTSNANAAHALSHALYESGAGEDAERLIADWLPGYDRAGSLHGHIAWHAALAALERGDPERALAIYADTAPAGLSAGMPGQCGQRRRLLPVAAPGLWPHGAGGAVGGGGRLFRVVLSNGRLRLRRCSYGHPGGGDRRQGRGRAARGGVDGLDRGGGLPAGPVVPAICRAALAFAADDYAGCARILEPVAAEVVRIGGSGAQREMIEDMLLLALTRSGEAVKARALLDRRLHRRPSPRDTRWRGLLAA